MVDVRAVIIVPDFLGLGFLGGGFGIEEKNVRFHALGIEDARRQAQDRVEIIVSRSFFLTVSPAPPSKRTLSGTTTAALPVVLSIVRMC